MPHCPVGELGERFAMPLKHTAHGRQNRRSTISIALSSLRALYTLKSFAEKAPGSLHSNVLFFLCRVLHKQRGADKFKWTDSRGQVVYQILWKEGGGEGELKIEAVHLPGAMNVEGIRNCQQSVIQAIESLKNWFSTSLNLYGQLISWMWIVHPPPSNIAKCLEKLRREKAYLVMLCPVWPSQPWFTVFLLLTCNVLIPSHDLISERDTAFF